MFKKFYPWNESKKRRKHSRSPSQSSLFSLYPSFSRRKKRIVLSYIKNIWDVFLSARSSSLILLWFWVLICWIFFLIYNPFLKVDTIHISRKDSIINITSAYDSVKYVRGKNLLFLDTASIAEKLQKGQKSIQNIEFEIDFPNSMNIFLTSYPAVFQSQWYIILSNGVMLKNEENRELDIPEMSVSQDIEEMSLFNKTLSSWEIKNISLLHDELEKNIPGFSLKSSYYYVTEKEILLQNDIDTVFIFDLNAKIQTQVQKLAVFQKEQEDITQKKYIYIDVRIPQKLFLCSYEQEFECRWNLKKIYNGFSPN